MSEQELNKIDKLVGTTLKLRSALSIALLALADIEQADTVEGANVKARAARLSVRAALRSGSSSAPES